MDIVKIPGQIILNMGETIVGNEKAFEIIEEEVKKILENNNYGVVVNFRYNVRLKRSLYDILTGHHPVGVKRFTTSNIFLMRGLPKGSMGNGHITNESMLLLSVTKEDEIRFIKEEPVNAKGKEILAHGVISDEGVMMYYCISILFSDIISITFNEP